MNYASAQSVTGYAEPSMPAEVTAPLTVDAIKRLSMQVEVARETEKVLSGLRDRLFGSEPANGVGVGPAPSNSAGSFANALRDGQWELTSLVQRINSLTHELNNRI